MVTLGHKQKRILELIGLNTFVTTEEVNKLYSNKISALSALQGLMALKLIKLKDGCIGVWIKV